MPDKQPTTAPPPATPGGSAVKPRRRRGCGTAIAIPLVLAGLFALYVFGALHFSYSQGERAGYVQKFSRKGWVCKTWEGELAMANLPGAMPQVFQFSVRDPQTAARITQLMGRRVALTYEQHRGVPTSCFGETEYFVVGVQPVGP
jgi:hypothetical protein